MSEFGDFLYQDPRPLPVILLLDTSGSMSLDENIETLKVAVREMIQNFKSSSNAIVSIRVGIIIFGGDEAELFLPLSDVSEIDVNCMESVCASGRTPMGSAIRLAKKIVDDRKQIPGRAYAPTVVAVTDGQPNDEWENALVDFIHNGRSARCERMAMGIGEEVKTGPAYEMLEKFVSHPDYLFGADDSLQISEFFRFVTMSTICRSHGTKPGDLANSGNLNEE